MADEAPASASSSSSSPCPRSPPPRATRRPAEPAGELRLRPATATHRNLRFTASPGVAANLQSLDLYLPVRPAACAPASRWSRTSTAAGSSVGDKANQLADKVNLFTRAGWAFASLNYRLVGSPGRRADERHVPRGGTGRRGGHRVPRRPRGAVPPRPEDRIMLLGHSSGANLVALVSTDGSLPPERRPHAATTSVCTAPLDTTYDIPHQVAGRRHQRGDVPQRVRRTTRRSGSRARRAATSPPGRGSRRSTSSPAVRRAAIAEAQAFGTTLRDAGVCDRRAGRHRARPMRR